ncbi:uncharacterized protein LOC116260720 isoform X2 [Nymphaea colorata]|nr:uncharacterized protein LOC116260720 isoform X2 [Nymphaea colorata]
MEIVCHPLISLPGVRRDRLEFGRRTVFLGQRLRSKDLKHRTLQITDAALSITKEKDVTLERQGDASASGDEKTEWLHFVGIGGNGLSAIAMLALRQGFKVSGSDLVWSSNMSRLKKAGARLHLGHSSSNLRDYDGLVTPSAVIKSSAIPADNEEILQAEASGMPVHSRGAWLGKITNQHNLIAVSGTHGKSTTTAMLAFVLSEMGENPTALVGAHVPQFSGGNILSGCGCHFVLEGDEYDGAFLELSPSVAVVTNIEWEHVDLFEDEMAVLEVFKRFLLRMKPGGQVIACGDSAGVCALLGRRGQSSGIGLQVSNSHLNVQRFYSTNRIATYGISSTNEWYASSVHPNKEGGIDYLLHYMGQPVTSISLQLPGVHNVLNSLAVIAAVTSLMDNKMLVYDTIGKIKTHLKNFVGVSRRFELIGKFNNCCIYDDYAHHPTEVCAVLQTARLMFPTQALWVVFQPHTFSRLAALLKSFVACFNGADYVVVTEVYPAREKNLWDVHGQDLASSVTGQASEYIPRLEDVINKLLFKIFCNRNQGVVIFTLGAGSITTLGPKLLAELNKQTE